MRSPNLPIRTCALGALSLLALTCSRDYNPFADGSNARCVVTSASFSNGDTLEVFDRESLAVALAVPALVDSYAVSCPGNRLFADTVLHNVSFGDATGVEHRFVVSYADTGLRTIRITSYRSGEEHATESFSVFVKSPLAPQQVNGYLGKPVDLKAAGVADDDVLYHWNFGVNTVIHALRPETTVVIRSASLAGVGEFWVSDVRDTSLRSPLTRFDFALNDNAGPEIVVVADSMRGDTVISGDVRPVFTVVITDQGSDDIESARLNGGPFDQQSPPRYYKELDAIDTLSAALPLRVDAVDRYSNQTTRHVWVAYDGDLATGKGLRLVRDHPTNDYSVSSRRKNTVAGHLENAFGGTDVVVQAQVNDSVHRNTVTISRLHGAGWSLPLYLDSTINRITVRGLDASSMDSLCGVSFTILHDPNLVDSAAPRIFEVSTGGKHAHNQQVAADSVVLTVIAYDEGSGIDEVRIGGKSIALNGEEEHRWERSVELIHYSGTGQGNRIAVSVIDRAGLSRDTSITIVHNNAPFVREGPTSPVVIRAGSKYRDTLDIVDKDNDALSVSKAWGPGGLTVSEDGSISWQTSSADTGKDTVAVLFWDPFTQRRYQWIVYVVDSLGGPQRVRFATAVGDFPSFIVGGSDTLRQQLAVVPGTGKAPFDWSAHVAGQGAELSGNNGLLQWAPALGDTGVQRLVVTVVDEIGNGDTLRPRIRVVPPNRPCSLTVSSSTPLSEGILDLRGATTPDTLRFAIHDEDHSEAEQHSVIVEQENVRTEGIIDSTGKVTVIVDPATSQLSRDTIRVIVADRVGHADTAKVIVKYDQPPSVPSNPSPEPNSYGVDSNSVTLSWSGGGSNVSYAVYLDTVSDPALLAEGLTGTSKAVSNLACGQTYYWRVAAVNSRGTVKGPLWSFTTGACLVQNEHTKKVKINTSATGANITENVYDFPLLVRLNATNFDFSRARSDGSDVWFRKADPEGGTGGTQLPHEIEQWDAQAQTAEVWVLIDTVRANSSSQYIEIVVDEGNGGFAPANSEDVFDTANAFTGVWHLGAFSGDTAYDATGLAHYGVKKGSGVPSISSGTVGDAVAFDGVNDYVSLGQDRYFASGASQVTLSAWIRPDGRTGDELHILSFSVATGSAVNASRSALMVSDSLNPRVVARTSGTADDMEVVTGNNELSLSQWYHFSAVIDYSRDSVYIFIDGELQSATPSSGVAFAAEATETGPSLSSSIGAEDDGSDSFFQGMVDEARVSTTRRSAQWIRLSYRTQKPGNSVLTVE